MNDKIISTNKYTRYWITYVITSENSYLVEQTILLLISTA